MLVEVNGLAPQESLTLPGLIVVEGWGRPRTVGIEKSSVGMFVSVGSV